MNEESSEKIMRQLHDDFRKSALASLRSEDITLEEVLFVLELLVSSVINFLPKEKDQSTAIALFSDHVKILLEETSQRNKDEN